MRDEQFESSDPYTDPWLACVNAHCEHLEARFDREVRRFLLVVVPIMVLGFAGTITAALVR